MSKFILHIDMDAFFSSCEEAENPELKGKPVVIGADPKDGKGRGVVATASYAARKFGINSAMPISKAYRLCPKAVFLRGNFELYNKTSKNIMQILISYSSAIQKVSIDEAYLDITELVKSKEDIIALANKIKKEILNKENITCSIGIGPNKLIAKTASDFQKPDGLTIIDDSEKSSFLAPMHIRKLRGIGPKMEAKLKSLGITTIGILSGYNKEKLIGKFGVYGYYLSMASQGYGSDTLNNSIERSSYSHEHTFDKDTNDEKIIMDTINKLASIIQKRMEKESFWFRTISIKVRLENFKTFTRAITLPYTTLNQEDIIFAANKCFKEFTGKKIRLIGIKVSNLQKSNKQKLLSEF